MQNQTELPAGSDVPDWKSSLFASPSDLRQHATQANTKSRKPKIAKQLDIT
jgi:hypothetical protein